MSDPASTYLHTSGVVFCVCFGSSAAFDAVPHCARSTPRTTCHSVFRRHRRPSGGCRAQRTTQRRLYAARCGCASSRSLRWRTHAVAVPPELVGRWLRAGVRARGGRRHRLRLLRHGYVLHVPRLCARVVCGGPGACAWGLRRCDQHCLDDTRMCTTTGGRGHVRALRAGGDGHDQANFGGERGADVTIR